MPRSAQYISRGVRQRLSSYGTDSHKGISDDGIEYKWNEEQQLYYEEVILPKLQSVGRSTWDNYSFLINEEDINVEEELKKEEGILYKDNDCYIIRINSLSPSFKYYLKSKVKGDTADCKGITLNAKVRSIDDNIGLFSQSSIHHKLINLYTDNRGYYFKELLGFKVKFIKFVYTKKLPDIYLGSGKYNSDNNNPSYNMSDENVGSDLPDADIYKISERTKESIIRDYAHQPNTSN